MCEIDAREDMKETKKEQWKVHNRTKIKDE